MTELELYHSGRKGMKWGEHIFGNDDGSSTSVSRKVYNQSLRADKQRRHILESKAYDSARWANLYLKKQKSINKKYEKAIAKDPNEEKQKTKNIKMTKSFNDSTTESTTKYHKQNVEALKNQVNSMVNKYKSTKIKDVRSEHKKNGVEFVDTVGTVLNNINAMYFLEGKTIYTGDGGKFKSYSPTKIRYYRH